MTQTGVVEVIGTEGILEDPESRLREYQARAIRAENKLATLSNKLTRGSTTQKVVHDVAFHDGQLKGAAAMLDRVMEWIRDEHPELEQAYYEYWDNKEDSDK